MAGTTLGGMTAIVTGGGSGIGRATALALSEAGADVVIAGRRQDALERTASLGTGIRTVVADVTRADDVERIVEAATATAGRLDVLVNNAAVIDRTPVGATDPDVARRLWAINVLGPSLLVEAAVGYLGRSRGTIVNVSSTFGTKPAPGVGQYAATKAAIEHLTRTWAVELAPLGIRVNAVAPGPTETEALERSGLAPEAIKEIKRQERDRTPLGRRGQPEDIAPLIVSLVAPALSWVTGQVIGIDGGFGLV